MADAQRPIRSASTWRKQWEARMIDCGYPRAYLDITHDHHAPSGLSYTWGADLDLFVNCHVANTEFIGPDHEAWETAHQVFVEVDHLRPLGIVRSPALAELMDGMN